MGHAFAKNRPRAAASASVVTEPPKIRLLDRYLLYLRMRLAGHLKETVSVRPPPKDVDVVT